MCLCHPIELMQVQMSHLLGTKTRVRFLSIKGVITIKFGYLCFALVNQT